MMSRDVYFRKVWKPDPPLPEKVDEADVSFDTPYRTYRLNEAPNWVKKVSQIVRVKRENCDIYKACKERFGKESHSATILFSPYGYEFNDDTGCVIGTIYRKDMGEFTYTTAKEEYVVQYEDIAPCIDNYLIQFDEGIHSPEEYLSEALRIIEDDPGCYSTYHAEAVYALIQCYAHAIKGDDICVIYN